MSGLTVTFLGVILYCVALISFLNKWEGLGSLKKESEPNGVIGFGSIVCTLTIFYLVVRFIIETFDLVSQSNSQLGGPYELLMGGYGYHIGLVLFSLGFTAIALGNYLAPSSSSN